MVIAIIILAYLLINTWISLIIATQSTIIGFDDLPLVLLMTVFNPFVCLAICWIIDKIRKMITKAHQIEKNLNWMYKKCGYCIFAQTIRAKILHKNSHKTDWCRKR